MVAIKQLPPVDYLRQCFDYDLETGALTWRERPREHFVRVRVWLRCNTLFAGKSAGTLDILGYRVVLIHQASYKVHRVVWKMVTDEEPPVTIDHVNGDPADNRWINLRAATSLQQNGNQRLSRANKSGYRGVSLYKPGKWKAKLGRHHLGYFYTPEEAALVYNAAAHRHFGEFYGRE